jgi:predicted enzyme related to lactoylglutathione lyase
MPSRDRALIGAPCWIDLMTSDVDRSRAFYAELFGWTAAEPNEEFGGYFMFFNGDSPVGGGMSRSDESAADVWSVYLASDDIAKTSELAATEGGHLHLEPMAVAELGSMAMVGDPAGASIGIWQPGTFQGFPVIAESGFPGWFELHTRDYAGSLAFYRAVFGWDTQVVSDVPDFAYTVVVDGDQQLAGVMEDDSLPDGVGARWDVYFGVGDTDATLARAVELGGTIVMPGMDTPYGRLAVATDTTGAKFSLVGPNASVPASAASA